MVHYSGTHIVVVIGVFRAYIYRPRYKNLRARRSGLLTSLMSALFMGTLYNKYPMYPQLYTCKITIAQKLGRFTVIKSLFRLSSSSQSH
jgi:hypothetical protein